MVTADSYAEALYQLTQDEKDSSKVVGNLIALLQKKGHMKLLPNILHSFEAKLAVGRDSQTLTFVCAREKDFEKFKNELTDHFEHADAKFTDQVIDDSIIGGYILKKDEVVVDASYKKKLLTLYQSATI